MLDIFNERAFVFWDLGDQYNSMRKVTDLMQDSQAYERMLAQPILAEGTMEKYFSWHDNEPGGGWLRKRIHKQVEAHTNPSPSSSLHAAG